MSGSHPKKTMLMFRFCRNELFEAFRKLHIGFEIHDSAKKSIAVMNMLNQPRFGDPHGSH